jgi:F0F1-type ATP synthase assembly protein I
LRLIQNKRIHTDDNLGRGMDLALSTLVFLFLGYLLDRWLGTEPVFMIVLFLAGSVGQIVRLWFDYDARMKTLEAERATATRSRREATP